MHEQSSRRAWLLTIAGMTMLFALAIVLRQHHATRVLQGQEMPLWLESAQWFRGIRFVASGQSIPGPDLQVQWPDGIDHRQSTLVQEYLLGTLGRLFVPAGELQTRLQPFVRAATRVLACLVMFPLFWLAYEFTRARWAALFSVGLILAGLGILERTTGLVIYRETVCIPLFALQLAALYVHFRRASGVRYAWISGGTLLVAHYTWKVTLFYQLFLLVALCVLVVWRPIDGRLRTAIQATCLPPLLASLLLPGVLQADRYWGTTTAALSLGLLCLERLAAWRPDWLKATWQRIVLLLGLSVGTRLLLPGGVSYAHAWDTLAAKLQFMGEKPDDPGLLPLSARHYWTGNYRSPTWQRVVREFSLPLALCVMLPRRLRSQREGLPNARLEGAGPSEGYGMVLLALGCLAFAVAYLLFRKFGTLLALFLVPWVALAAVTVLERARHRWRLGVGVLACIQLMAWVAAWNNVGADAVVQQDDEEPIYGVVYDLESLDGISHWLRTNTQTEDPLLASWAISPFLFTYLDRTTILNAFFESPAVTRYEEFNLALFGSLERLHAWCRQYGARYLIVEAHFLLRVDKWMAYRFVADHLELSGEEALYRLHYGVDGEGRPGTPGFGLVFQNTYFRVYRVLADPTTIVSVPPLPYSPLFDPAVPGAQVGMTPQTGAQLLYGLLEAGRWVQVADAWAKQERPEDAVEALRRGLQSSSYAVDVYRRLIPLLASLGEVVAARQVHQLGLERFGPAAGLPPPE